MKRVLFIILLLLILPVTLAIWLLPESSDQEYGIKKYVIEKENEVGNSFSNIRNGGFVAAQDDWVFFKKSSDYDSPSKDFLMGRKEGEDTNYKIAPNHLRFINVRGEWVFYTSSAFLDEERLFKVKLDGTHRKKLAESASYVQVIGNWIYYYDTVKNGFYKMDIHNNKPIPLFTVPGDGGEIFLVDDENIYFYIEPENSQGSQGKLYSLSLKSNRAKKLNDDIHYFMSIEGVDGQFLYYQEESGLFRIDKNNGQKKRLIIPSTIIVVIEDDYIYYTNQDKQGYLYRVTKDGRNKMLLLKKNAHNINIHGDWIYYQLSDYSTIYRVKTDGTEDMLFQK